MGWPWTKHWKLRSKSIGYGWFGWRRTESFGRSLQASWLSCDFEAPTPQNFTRCKGISGWWNFIFFVNVRLYLGKMNPFWLIFLQMGWNHQPVTLWFWGFWGCFNSSFSRKIHHPWPHRSPNHRVVGFSTKLVMRWFRATKMRWAHVERRYLMYQYLFWWMATSIL